jgi:hypothetical protein
VFPPSHAPMPVFQLSSEEEDRPKLGAVHTLAADVERIGILAVGRGWGIFYLIFEGRAPSEVLELRGPAGYFQRSSAD